MVHSLIGLFAGVFGNAPGYAQLTHGIFDDIFAALEPAGDLYFSRGHTTTVFYNEVALGRWLERTVRDLGHPGHHRRGTRRRGAARRLRLRRSASPPGTGTCGCARPGTWTRRGDAALTWQAGLPCWVPSRPIYGSQQVIVENLDEAHKPETGEIDALFAARGEEFGLLRRGGLAFFFPGRGTAVLNVTHIDAPLDPVDAARAMFEGRDQADAAIALLRVRVPQGVRRGAGAGLRVPRAAADALDPRARTSSRWTRCGRRHRLRRRGRPDGVAGGTARPQRRLRVGDVPRRPRALRAAAVACCRRARTTWSPRGGASTATPPRCPACG